MRKKERERKKMSVAKTLPKKRNNRGKIKMMKLIKKRKPKK